MGEETLNLTVLTASLGITHKSSEFIYPNAELVESTPHLGEHVASTYPRAQFSWNWFEYVWVF